MGVGGHGAAPPVYRSGPHATGTANTGNVSFCRAVLLPSQVSVAALLAPPNGLFTHRTFYAQVIQPEVDSSDAACAALVDPVVDWFQAASTEAADPTKPAVAADAILDVAPAAAQALKSHGVLVRQELL